MKYQCFILGELQTNCYLLWSETEAGVIDPGGPADEVIRFIAAHGLTLKWIVIRMAIVIILGATANCIIDIKLHFNPFG